MKNLIFLLIAISSVSCMSTIMDDDYSSIPPDVKPYVDDFFKIAHSKGLNINPVHLKVNLINNEGFVAGQANLSNETITINIKSTSWKINPESVIFHELGHLYLHRGHDDSEINGYQKSIMNTYSVMYWNSVRQYYVDELFDPNTKTIPIF